jgi:hypothetical protein
MAARRPEKWALLIGINTYPHFGPDDTILLHFSGHGSQRTDGPEQDEPDGMVGARLPMSRLFDPATVGIGKRDPHPARRCSRKDRSTVVHPSSTSGRTGTAEGGRA